MDKKIVEKWLVECQKIVDKGMEPYAPSQKTELRIAKGGRRYLKVLAFRFIQGDNGKYKENGCSAWGFVDTANGDVLKAASFRAPAKHARGNVFDEHEGLSWITTHGPAYLAR